MLIYKAGLRNKSTRKLGKIGIFFRDVVRRKLRLLCRRQNLQGFEILDFGEQVEETRVRTLSVEQEKVFDTPCISSSTVVEIYPELYNSVGSTMTSMRFKLADKSISWHARHRAAAPPKTKRKTARRIIQLTH